MVYREYVNILEQLDKIVCYSDKEIRKTITDIGEMRRKEHTYFMKDGSSLSGKLVDAVSSSSLPRVLLTIDGMNTFSLEGTLFGSKSEMGVALNDVVDIR